MDDESFFSTQTWGLSFKTVRNPNLKEESSPNIIITSDSPMRKLCESSHPTRVFISNCSSSSKHGGFYVKNLWLVFCLALCPKIADGRITRQRQCVRFRLFYPQFLTTKAKVSLNSTFLIFFFEWRNLQREEKSGEYVIWDKFGIFAMRTKLLKFNTVQKPYSKVTRWRLRT